MTTTKTQLAALAIVLAAVAIVAPGAGAVPIDSQLPATINAPAGINSGYGPSGGVTRAVATEPRQAASSSRFDWGDAGLGSAATLSLLGLGAGVVAAWRRSQRRHPVLG